MLLFLDQNNEPLHKHPVQLTARGYFQVDLDKNIMSFRKNMELAYAEAKLKTLGQITDIWHAMRHVFSVLFLKVELLVLEIEVRKLVW